MTTKSHGSARAGGLFLPSLGCLALLAVAPAVGAETDQSSAPRVQIGINSWLFTQGRTTWSHDASGVDSRLGNPTSKLTYKDNDTHILELTGKLNLTRGWFVRADVGFSVAFNRGTLIDDDYSSVGGQHLFSQTSSNVNGSGTQYVNADVGFRLLDYAGQRGYVDFFGGYQYWRTKYEATGVTQLQCNPSGIPGVGCNPAGTTTNQGQLVITNTEQWHSLRLGLQSEYRLTRRFSVEGKAAFIPLSYLQNDDIHHLRGDLQQNPSFSMSGIGIGADAEAGVRFMLLRRLFLNAGYRFWWNRVVDGTWKNHPVGSSSESVPLKEFQTYRHGLTIGVSYIF